VLPEMAKSSKEVLSATTSAFSFSVITKVRVTTLRATRIFVEALEELAASNIRTPSSIRSVGRK